MKTSIANLAELSELIRPGVSAYGRSVLGRGRQPISLINTSDIRAAGLNCESCEITTVEDLDDVALSRVQTGDVLLNIRGTSFRSAVCPPEAQGFVASANVAIIRLRKDAPLGPHLLQAVLSSPAGAQALHNISQGTLTLAISPKQLGTLTFNLPSAEQVAQLEQLAIQNLEAAALAEQAAGSRSRVVQALINPIIQA